MSTPRRWLPVTIVSLFLLAAIQQAFAARLSIWGAEPDFLLVGAICLSLLADRSRGAIAGFLAGLAHGALAGSNLAAYAASRAVGGFCASWSKVGGYEIRPLSVGTVTFAVSILTGVVWMLIGLRSGIGGFLAATIGTAMVNGVLAMPMYALLRRLADPPRR